MRARARARPLGRDAIVALIAQDERGHQRLDVSEGAHVPGGYRIERTLRLPIVLNGVREKERAAEHSALKVRGRWDSWAATSS